MIKKYIKLFDELIYTSILLLIGGSPSIYLIYLGLKDR